jgi:hypothetical protein
MANTPGWEYSVYTSGSTFKHQSEGELETVLNDLGEQGWEVASATSIEGSGKVRIILKRPLTSAVRRERSMPDKNF